MRTLLLTLVMTLGAAAQDVHVDHVVLKVVAVQKAIHQFHFYQPSDVVLTPEGQLSRTYKAGEVVSCDVTRSVRGVEVDDPDPELAGQKLTLMVYTTTFQCGGNKFNLQRVLFPSN